MAFTYPHEAHLAKTLLEAESIEVQVKDEHTIQAHPFYSNAIGGVKLQIRPTDYHTSAKILQRSGYNVQPSANTEQQITDKLDKFSAQLPIIGKEPLPRRLFIFFIVLGLVIGILLYNVLY